MLKKAWKLYFKIFLFFFVIIFTVSAAKCELTPVDAARNAKEHNNQGVIFMREGDYLAAIKEFKIAIGINPNVQSTSVYYNNLGQAYMKIYAINKNHLLPIWAQNCFEHALTGDCLNLTYYKNLVNAYEARGNLNSRASYHLSKKSENPYNAIVVGLIYLKQNKIGAAITILDDFCAQNPDLVITSDIKRLIAQNEFI